MVRTRGVASISPQHSTNVNNRTDVLQDRTNVFKTRHENGLKNDETGKRRTKAAKSSRGAATIEAARHPSNLASATAPANRVVPAVKAHRPPRLTRKPLRTHGVSVPATHQTVSAKKTGNIHKVSKMASSRRSNARSGERLRPSVDDIISQDDAVTQSQHDGTQRVAESVYPSSYVTSKTPAMDRSILALKNFKRRPRQPSMLTMVKQRLASARSSLAGAEPDFALEESDDSFELGDDFLPDAAGTPMYSSGPDTMGLGGRRNRAEQAQNPRKRNRASLDFDHSTLEIDGMLHKHHKLVSQSDEEDEALYNQDIAIEHDDLVRSTPEMTINNQQYTDDSLHIDTLLRGSPIDSSPLDHDPRPASIYGPPVTQQTPMQRQTRTAARKAPMSTAVLQSLLPKRRKQLFDSRPVPTLKMAVSDDDTQWDVGYSSSIEVDTSEYTIAKHGAKKTKSKNAHPRARRALQETSPNVNRSPAANDTSKRSRTYGRRKPVDVVTQDPDGQDGKDDRDNAAVAKDVTFEAVAKSHELAAARQKFAEVDRWEMEFETLTTEDSAASSQGWR